MALADITTTTGRTYVYTNAPSPGRTTRTDVTNGTITEPRTLEMAHTSGTSSKPARSVIQINRTKLNADSIPKGYKVYTVIVRDVDPAITDTIVNEGIAEMADVLADSAIMGSFTKGGHY